MQIAEAKYENGWLMLNVSPAQAMQWLYKFKPNEYDIVKSVKKRSLNANSYAWLLMSKIADKMRVSVEEVYKHQIADIGGKTTAISIKSIAADDFEKAFVQGHIGRKVQLIGEGNGYKDLLLTYGSSDYDTAQMSKLIDNILQDCKAMDIETMDEANLASLLNDWRNHG